MKRLAIIGNSHVGAPRIGWERVRERFPGVSVEFFAAPGEYFPLLELAPGLRLQLPDTLVAERGQAFDTLNRINGRMGIDLAPADTVIWVGYRWPWAEIAELATTHDIDGLPAGGNTRLMSRAAFDAICAAFADELVPSPKWLWSAPRLVIAMRPVRVVPAEGKRARRLQGSRALQAAGLAARRHFFDHLQAVLSTHGIGLFRQPEETLTPYGTTRMEFSRGAVRMSSGRPFPPEDNAHMNADFGSLWWERLLGWLDTHPLPPAPPHRAA